MGDIRTHRLIYETFIRGHLPDGVDPIYVELGNYLTDVSQFRDPWAHVGGKASVWRENVGSFSRFTLAADIVGADGYFDLLLGRPDDDDLTGRDRVPHGLLGQWFRAMIYVISLENNFRQGSNYLTEPDEFKRLYDNHYTQYFPHEHLDYQPLATGKLNEFPRSSVPLADGTPRRIVEYLDRHIEYVGDLLTNIEHRWVRRDDPPTPQEQHDALVMFGHACHALEDFFFHSNFVDLASAIQRGAEADVPRFDPAEVRDDTDPDGDRVPPPDSVRWDRIDFRRKRQPVYAADGDGESEFDQNTSTEAEIVFTSSIPIPDIFHTFFDAIGHLSERPRLERSFVDAVNETCRDDAPKAKLLALVMGLGGNGILALPHALMATFVPGEDEFEDEDAPEDEAREARLKEAKKLRDDAHKAYRCLVEHDVLAEAARTMVSAGLAHESVADAIAEASRIERELWDALPGFLGIDDDAGAAKFMIQLLEQGRNEVHKATNRSRELDDANRTEKAAGVPPEERSGYVPSDNRSTAERIGTHSLMSKDSIRKQPLRRQAINGAGFLVSHVTKTMALQANPATRAGGGVDWQQLIRHFLTHPEQAGPDLATAWWRAALEWDRGEASRPDEGHTPIGTTQAEVARRRGEAMRRELQLEYNDLVAEGERRFRRTINGDWVIGSTLWGGLFGAGFGLLGAKGGSASHKVGGTLLGMAGGLASGALVSGVATAIDDRAGSVVGLLVGLGTAVGVGYTFGELAKDL